MRTIWVGTIYHRHGVNFYAGTTQDTLIAQLADYCVDWVDNSWEHQTLAELYLAFDNKQYRRVLEIYFDVMVDEWYDLESVDVFDEFKPRILDKEFWK